MKKIEIIFGFFVLIGIAMIIMRIPGGSLVCALFFLFLSTYYGIRSFTLFRKKETTNGLEKALGFLICWVNVALCFGILFSLLMLPGSGLQLFVGLLGLLIISILSTIFHSANRIDLHRIGLLGCSIYAGVGLALLLIPQGNIRPISDVVIDKFIKANDQMERSNLMAENRNVNMLKEIRNLINEGSRHEDLELLNSAEALRKKSSSTLSGLEDQKGLFVEITGGYLDWKYVGNRSFIIGKYNSSYISDYMMSVNDGSKSNGEELMTIVTDYRDFVIYLMKNHGASELLLSNFEDLVPNAEEDPLYKQYPESTGDTWPEWAFEYLPTHASLATLSEMQKAILEFETIGLEHLLSVAAKQ